MLRLPLSIPAEEALFRCQSQCLVVASHRELTGRDDSHHWHLRIPGRAGTLELSEWQGQAWVQVHPRREGTWASRFARDLASGLTRGELPR